uniref:Uncharacterized protein n=1 Tax=Anguilla anguilla TaxID=7936 RepID=A0A0E9QHD2_ANGAN
MLAGRYISCYAFLSIYMYSVIILSPVFFPHPFWIEVLLGQTL